MEYLICLMQFGKGLKKGKLTILWNGIKSRDVEEKWKKDVIIYSRSSSNFRVGKEIARDCAKEGRTYVRMKASIKKKRVKGRLKGAYGGNNVNSEINGGDGKI